MVHYIHFFRGCEAYSAFAVLVSYDNVKTGRKRPLICQGFDVKVQEGIVQNSVACGTLMVVEVEFKVGVIDWVQWPPGSAFFPRAVGLYGIVRACVYHKVPLLSICFITVFNKRHMTHTSV